MKKLFLSILIALSSLSVLAQQPGQKDREEKVKALYVAFITQQLNFTSAEAQAFWPVHAQFETEIKNINPSLSELEKQQQALNIKKKYNERFQKIIGNDRTDEFFKQDGEFRKKMIDRLRQMRQNEPPRKKPR